MSERVAEYKGVATVATDKAVVCFRDLYNWLYGTCGALSAAGDTLQIGALLVVNEADTAHLVVATLSSNKAVVCYQDTDDMGHGKCAVLTVTGQTLAKGGDFTFEAGFVSGLQRHINGVVSKNKEYDNLGFGGIKRPF